MPWGQKWEIWQNLAKSGKIWHAQLEIALLVRRLVRQLVRQLVRRIENKIFQKKVCNPSRSNYNLGVSHNDDTIKLKFYKGLK